MLAPNMYICLHSSFSLWRLTRASCETVWLLAWESLHALRWLQETGMQWCPGRDWLSLALFYIYGFEFKSSYPNHHAQDDKVYSEGVLVSGPGWAVLHWVMQLLRASKALGEPSSPHSTLRNRFWVIVNKWHYDSSVGIRTSRNGDYLSQNPQKLAIIKLQE